MPEIVPLVGVSTKVKRKLRYFGTNTPGCLGSAPYYSFDNGL